MFLENSLQYLYIKYDNISSEFIVLQGCCTPALLWNIVAQHSNQAKPFKEELWKMVLKLTFKVVTVHKEGLVSV